MGIIRCLGEIIIFHLLAIYAIFLCTGLAIYTQILVFQRYLKSKNDRKRRGRWMWRGGVSVSPLYNSQWLVPSPNGYLLLLITVGHKWDIRNQIKNQNSSTQPEFWFQLIRNSNDFSNSGSG